MISVCDGPMETACYVEYIWVKIRCMLGWSIGFGHKTAELHFFRTRAQLMSAQNETLL